MGTLRQFYLDGKTIQPPKNGAQTAIKFSFDKDSATTKQEITVTDYNFVKDNADAIMKWYRDGRVFEGMPFRYELSRGTSTDRVFDGYLDFTDGAILTTQQDTTLKAKVRQRLDYLNDTADSVSFPYLDLLGEIPQDKRVDMPYVISTIPNYYDALITTATTASIAFQLAEQIEQLTELLATAANPFEWTVILRAVLRVAAIVTLLALLISLLGKLFMSIIQPVKYHSCIRAVDLLQIGCERFGFTLNAPDLQTAPFNDMVVMPEKFFNPALNGSFSFIGIDIDYKGVNGYTSPDLAQTPYPKTTFGDFLRNMKQLFCAKVLISTDINSNILTLIREDRQTGIPVYQIPPVYEPQFGINASELKSNVEISFLTDINDKNTLQQYLGTSFQVITTQVGLIDPQLSLVKNLEDIRFPYALAKTKRELTLPEEIFQGFLDEFGVAINALIAVVKVVSRIVSAIVGVVNIIIDALNLLPKVKIPEAHGNFGGSIQYIDTSDIIKNRKGMLLLENDFINTQKLFIVSQGSEPKYNKIHADNDTILSAKNLWTQFYGPAISFLPSTGRPTGNQFLVKTVNKIPFTFKDYQSVIDNNAVFTSDGQIAQVIEGEWNPYQQVANLKVKIPFLYTNKLQETYIESNGQ